MHGAPLALAKFNKIKNDQDSYKEYPYQNSALVNYPYTKIKDLLIAQIKLEKKQSTRVIFDFDPYQFLLKANEIKWFDKKMEADYKLNKNQFQKIQQNINCPYTEDGHTLLTQVVQKKATQENKIAMIQATMKLGADINGRNQHGQTAVMIAAENGEIDVVCSLIQHGANIHLRNQHGKTVLMIAAQRGHIAIVKELIQHGANIHARNLKGESIVMIAAKAGKFATYKAWLKLGANPKDKDQKGCSTLYHVAKQFAKEGGSSVATIADAVDFLQVHGYNLAQKNPDPNPTNKGGTLADLMVSNPGRLVELGTNDNLTKLIHPSYRQTASTIAIQPSTAISPSTPAQNPNLNAQLEQALAQGDEEAIENLLKQGADPHAKNSQGYSPLDGARAYLQQLQNKSSSAYTSTTADEAKRAKAKRIVKLLENSGTRKAVKVSAS